jgi:phosphatidylinositol alpha-mannosyltransferase
MKYGKRAPQTTSRFDAKNTSGASGLARRQAGAVLKIGFVFDDSLDSYDGVAQYVKNLGAWLSSQGHEVRYLVGETKMLEWAGGKVYSLSKNKKVSFNGNQARIPLIASKRRIKKVLATEQFDVLHVQVPYSPFMAQKVINAAGKNVAIIGTFHVAPADYLSNFGGHLLRIAYGKSINRFDYILSVSSAAEKYAKNAFRLKSKILPNVVDLDFYSSADTKTKTRDILFFGRLVQRKGARELIFAFNILQQHDKKARLTIAGKGPMEKELKNLVGSFGISEKVEFLGFIEEADKPKLLASADIACYPSTGGESFGIVLLEAMAVGAGIVIAGDNVGYRSVLGKKPELLFNPKNALSFAGKLSEFRENKNLKTKLHHWQQNEVKQYDVNIVGSNLVEIYNEAIANH